ncbi:MAG: hypothetical protein HZC37_03720 [Burkholderiales bacterium]|nr:hypothetical protein [Burkholderiales bacterium]
MAAEAGGAQHAGRPHARGAAGRLAAPIPARVLAAIPAVTPALQLGCWHVLARWQAAAARGPVPGLSLVLIGARQLSRLVGL